MNSFTSWFATSPIASFLRTAIGIGFAASLKWVAENIGNLQISPIALALVAAVIPPALRAANPADGVFGKGNTTVDPEAPAQA